MSHSCFGCCSLSTGINYIFVFNIIYIVLSIMMNFALYEVTDSIIQVDPENSRTEITSSRSLIIPDEHYDEDYDEVLLISSQSYTTTDLNEPIEQPSTSPINVDYTTTDLNEPIEQPSTSPINVDYATTDLNEPIEQPSTTPINVDYATTDLNEPIEPSTTPINVDYATTDLNDPNEPSPPPAINVDIYKDILFIATLGWSVMEFYLNVRLKQSTYKASPESVYAWLVIYYANLISCVFMVAAWKHNVVFADIIIIGIEAYVVQSYYNQQKMAEMDRIVDLKWKYVPSSETECNKTQRFSRTENDSDYIPVYIKNLRSSNS